MTDPLGQITGTDREPAGTPEEGERLEKFTRLELRSTDVGPTNADIERLCDAWAEVGRTILFRMKQGI